MPVTPENAGAIPRGIPKGAQKMKVVQNISEKNPRGGQKGPLVRANVNLFNMYHNRRMPIDATDRHSEAHIHTKVRSGLAAIRQWLILVESLSQ